MAERYDVFTNDSVNVSISAVNDDKCIPIEKSFFKNITVKELKNKLELLTGAASATMTVKIFNDDKLIGLLDKDDALLGSYHIDDGMRLHIEDSFLMRKVLEDESNAEKYMMTPDEYNKRNESCPEKTQSIGQSVPIGKSRGRGLVRKNKFELLNDVEGKKLRRPVIPPNAKILEECTLLQDVAVSSSSSHNVNDKIEQRMASLSVKSDKNIDSSVVANESSLCTKEVNNSFNSIQLNPDAKEFVPSFIRQDTQCTSKKTEIEIVDPKTGQPVTFNDCNDDAIYGRDEFNDEVKVVDVILAVSDEALRKEESPSQFKYENEVNDVLSSIEDLLSNSPGLFSSIITALNDIFCRWIKYDSTLEAVASKIVEQSVANNSYAYFGAKFCASLDRLTLSNNRHPPFRSYVLTQCESFFDQLQALIESDNYSKGHNAILFLAELFVQLTNKGSERITTLGEAILKSLNLLLSNPMPENVRCLCKILKLSGWALDEDLPEITRELIHKMTQLKAVNEFETHTVNMLNSVINLASLSWGRSSNNNSSSVVLSPTSPPFVTGDNFNFTSYYSKITGNVYGPDGAVLTEEESKFLNDNCKSQCDYEDDGEEFNNFAYDIEDEVVSDDMDEEACEAYEQFLLSVPQSNYRNAVNNVEK